VLEVGDNDAKVDLKGRGLFALVPLRFFVRPPGDALLVTAMIVTAAVGGVF
jgi:hypothetical protein